MWHEETKPTPKWSEAASSGAMLTLLALASIATPAAERCSVSESVVGVPDGRAAWVSGGFQSIPQPTVQIRTIHHSVGTIAVGSAAPVASVAPATRDANSRVQRPESKNDQQRLFTAVFEGDVNGVRRLLNSDSIDVNAPSSADRRISLIDVAASVARPQITRMLIEHSARVRGPLPAVDVHPIAVAVLNLQTTVEFQRSPGVASLPTERTPADFEATIRELLDAGADPDDVLDPTHPQVPLGELLSMPRFDGDLRIARMLLDHGANVGAAAGQVAPLATAVTKGRDDFVELALDGRSVDRSALDAALASAIARQNEVMVAKLLGAGASPDANDQYGRPVLCWDNFAPGPPRSISLLLIQHGAQLNIDCVSGPPLNLAIGDLDLAVLMMDHGADPRRADRHGATALDLVADSDHALIDAILKRGGRLGQPFEDAAYFRDLEQTAPLGPTGRAILRHKDYLASRLLQRDGLAGENSCTAVIYAAATGASRTLDVLMHQGGDPNSTTDRGISALMAAAYHGEDEALGVLLSQPRIEVNSATPTKFNRVHFLTYDEDPDPIRTGHRTALMYAAATGRTTATAMLLQHGANARETDAEGLAARDYARSADVQKIFQPPHP